MTILNFKTFKLDPEGKTVIILEGFDRETATKIRAELRSWYKGDEPFCLFYLEDRQKVRFERVDGSNKS